MPCSGRTFSNHASGTCGDGHQLDRTVDVHIGGKQAVHDANERIHAFQLEALLVERHRDFDSGLETAYARGGRPQLDPAPAQRGDAVDMQSLPARMGRELPKQGFERPQPELIEAANVRGHLRQQLPSSFASGLRPLTARRLLQQHDRIFNVRIERFEVALRRADRHISRQIPVRIGGLDQ